LSSPRSRTAFLIGAASNWLAFAATLAVAFVLTPYLIDRLGKPRYDVWCVVESVLAYFTLLDMGVAACLVRYVAKHNAEQNRDGLNRMASACLALFAAAGGVALVIGVPVLFAMAGTLTAKADGDPGVLPFMLLMLANLAVTLPLSVFPSILDGLERYTAKSVVRLLALAARVTGMVAVVNDGGGLWPLAVVYTAVNLTEHAVMAGLCVRFLPGLRFRPSLVDRATLRDVRTYSVDAFLAMLAGRVTVQTGAILVGLMLPAGQVTFFATSARLVEYAKSLLRTITTTLTPNVAALEARGDHAAITRLFLTATRWVLYAVLPVNVGLVLFGGPFLRRWVGEEFVAGSYPALVVLSATLTLAVAQSAASRILYGLGRLRWFARAALAESGVNVLLTLALIKPFGVTGVATAVAVPNVIFCVLVIGLTCRELRVSVTEYVVAWVRPVGLTLIPAAVWLAIGPPAADYPSITAEVLAGLVPYVVLVVGAEIIRRSSAWSAGGRRPVPVRPPFAAGRSR
jgi:O-antigen/teichoic acid export membrane protein